jgi:hypothetical protein
VNEQWRTADAEAHEAKAEALSFACGVLEGVTPVLDSVEQPILRNAHDVLERARERHEQAAKLGAVA